MNDVKNQQALASAFRRAKGKSVKIKELGITPDYSEEQVDSLIKKLAEKKAEESGKEAKEHIKGMRWYVEDLVKFSGLDAKDRLDYEYQLAFADVASEEELINALEELV